jgi:hypothetical protein
MFWQNDQQYKKDKSKPRKPVNILIPAAIGVIVWFVSSTYFDHQSSDKPIQLSEQKQYKIMNAASESSVRPRSYHLIGKNKVRLPPTDVFIDVARF